MASRWTRPTRCWRRFRRGLPWFVLAIATAGNGCSRRETAEPVPVPPVTSSAVLDPTAPPAASSSASLAPAPGPVVLVAGGDIDLSRRTGQRILRDPSLDPLRDLQPLLASADIRFANLESQLCELGGVTGSPDNPLVFAGPPAGAAVLQRSHFDVLSTANNHAWDFGKRCLAETITLLRGVGIEPVGTDAEGKSPLRPVVLERRGRKIAVFATTAIFNDGPLPKHAAAPYLAYADMGALSRRIAAIRAQVDWVVVSVHIGEEYMHEPIAATRYVLVAAVDAGADLVLGHHTHTPQRVEFHRGKPVVFSLGNLVFHENSSHPWTGWGALARVKFDPARSPQVEMCPYHLVDASAKPLGPKEEAVFLAHWDAISKTPASARRAHRSDDGCFSVEPP